MVVGFCPHHHMTSTRAIHQARILSRDSFCFGCAFVFRIYSFSVILCSLLSLSLYIYSFLLFQLHCLYPFWLRSIFCFIFILLCLFGESCGSLTFIDVNVSNCSLLIQLFVWSCLRFVPHV